MAKKISQRIALEGGDEFRAGLKNLGQEGQRAFQSVRDAASGATSVAIKMAPVLDSIKRKLKDVSAAAGNVHDKFNDAGTSIKKVGTNLAEIGIAVSGLLVGFGLLVKGASDAADTVGKTADALGITTQQLQHLQFAAGASNLANEDLEKGLLKLAASANISEKRNLQLGLQQDALNKSFYTGKISMEDYLNKQLDLNKSTTAILDPFRRLGVSVRDNSGHLKNSRTLLLDLADAFKTTNDTALKLQITTELFGTRAGKPFIDLLNQGSAGILAFEKEAERLAPAFTKAEIAIGQKFGDTLDLLGRSITSAKNSFLLLFAPTLTDLMTAAAEGIAANRQALLQFGQTIITQTKPAVDDLFRLMRGDAIDPSGFVGKLRTAILEIKADVVQAAIIIKSTWDGVVSVLDAVANIINNIFGTDLSGQALAITLAFAAFTGVLGAVASAVTAVIAVIGLMVAIFGGVNVALAAVGVALGYVFGKLLVDLFSAAPQLVDTFRQELIDGWNGTIENFKSLWQLAMVFLTDQWTNFKNYVLDGIATIVKAAIKIANTFSFGSNGGNNNQNGGGPALAGGGLLRGPGTSTSDSIRAWLSDGEFVVKAKAVKHYGASFFAALNRMTIPSPKLALGGLVSSLNSVLPRDHYATGGLVHAVSASSSAGGRPVILKIGENSFPMVAGQDTVNRLERFAASKQIRSTGRKPTWAS